MSERPGDPTQKVLDTGTSEVGVVLHADGSVHLQQSWGNRGAMKVILMPTDHEDALRVSLALLEASVHMLRAHSPKVTIPDGPITEIVITNRGPGYPLESKVEEKL